MRRLAILMLACLMLVAPCYAQDKPYRLLNSFSAGELSELLNAREDLSKYHSGTSIMENMIPLPQGGAQKRPGTVYVAESKENTVIRLIPFEFSTTQSYIIELGNQYMRFFTDNDVVYETYGTEDLSGIGSIVAHWKCDDNLGDTVVIDADGATHNSVASANTNTLTTTDAEGTDNEAFNLNSINYFTLADDADFSFGNSSSDSPFTFLMWAYFPTATESGALIAKGGASTPEREYAMSTTSGYLQLRLYDNSEASGAYRRIQSNDTISAGWHFIGATYTGIWDSSTVVGESGTKLGIRLYIDGISVATNIVTLTAGYVAMENLTEEVCIGASAESHVTKWSGKIDNVAIFNKTLTPVEIASLTGSASTTVYEIVSPYLTADLFDLKMEQSADVLYLTHPDYETRKLSRLSNSIWSLEAIGIENGPFQDQNTDINAKIAASATTGSVTLTATGHAPFVDGTTAGHEPSGSATTAKSQTGTLFKLVHPVTELEYQGQLEEDVVASQVEDVSWMDCGVVYKGTTWTLVTGETWYGTIKVQRNYTIGAIYATAGWEDVLEFSSGVVDAAEGRNVSTAGTENLAAAQYRIIYADELGAGGDVDLYFSTNQTEHIGIVKITAVASTTSATATVLTTLGSTDATHKWSEGAWSNYRGWPRTATFFEDRLCFGGNSSQPDTIWGSVTADYENMLEGADDDDALNFTLSSRMVNIINWIIGKDRILIGTSGAEWTLAGSSDEPLTPSNVKAEQHSTYGSTDMQANQVSESVLFFQRGAEKMRELAYNWELDAYVAPDMTILNPEVTGDGITDTAFQQIPDPILWCVKENGDLAIFVYERKEQITSWSRFITDGDFESVAIIHGDPEDEVWVSVMRTIGGTDQRYIEYFSARDWGSDPCDAFYVDSGITYDSTATTTITGLTHLEGETVAVLGDSVVLGDEIVSGSSITIDVSSLTVQAGLPYTVQMRTMPLSWVGDGTIQGRIKRVNEVVARYFDSGDFYIGRDATTKELVSITGVDTDEQRVTFPAGYNRPGYVFIYQQSPEPLTLVALMIEFMVY